ncbi:MAG: hypothetical protein MR802_01790 [Prevotella sp.]|nr:hypothetical protein [Prevotella sp.]MCI6485278.1 hypothetical protein [Bacteroidales bacterium]
MFFTDHEFYRIEFVFERCYVDSEYGVNFTDGFSEITCSVNGGPSISLNIEDLMLDTCEPASARGSDYSRVTENYHAVFEILAEKVDLSKIKFYTYGRPTFLQYINIDTMIYDGKRYFTEEEGLKNGREFIEWVRENRKKTRRA